ncbi:MAG: hypothetical protein GY845_26005 [Planctomycetes bacterium]|nr:hypothetical protein [Planctomycetota bacterium]
MYLLCVLVCLGCLLAFLEIDVGVISEIFFWVALLLALILAISLFALKLEISDLDEQDESQEKVR